MKSCHRELLVPLSEAELNERRDRMALDIQRQGDLSEEKKRSAAGFREQIDELRAGIEKAAREIRSKSGPAQVECEWSLDGGRRVLRRLDTGEVVEEHEASAEEMNAKLPLDEDDVVVTLPPLRRVAK